jgi:Tol biopolymer transport system component
VNVLGATITPDGNFIDYLTSPRAAAAAELWRVPLLGGTGRRIAQDVQSLVAWDPVGQRMAFVRRRPDGAHRLIVAASDASGERVLATRSGDKQFHTIPNDLTPPAWSPDGKTIAVSGADRSLLEAQVVLIDTTSGAERALNVGAAVRGIAWDDDRHLLLILPSENSDVPQLWRLSVSDGKQSRLTTDVEPYTGLSVTTDKRSLVATRTPTRIGIWVGAADGATGREIVSSLYWPQSSLSGARIGWLGERLLITEYSRGRPAAVTVMLEGARAKLMDDVAGALGSPDGRFVVFPSADGVSRSDADGRNVRRLSAEPALPDSIAPNGDVLFVSKESGSQAPWRVNVAGDAPRRITETFALARSLAVSGDGRRLAFVTTNGAERRLIVCDYPACRNRAVQNAPLGRPLRWTPDGSGIAYIDGATETNVWVMPLNGAQAYQLTRFTDGRRLGDFDWAQGGSRLAVAHGRTSTDIVLIKRQP